MRLNIISTIFKKEIKEVLRDKRMIYLIILMPFFLYPVLLSVMGSVQASQQEKLNTEKIDVWMPPYAKGSPVFRLLSEDKSLKIELRDFNENTLKETKKTIGILIESNFQEILDKGGATSIQILADHSQDLIHFRARNIQAQLSSLNEKTTTDRLDKMGLKPNFIKPFSVNNVDLSPQKGGNQLLTSMIPIMIFMFIYLGCFNIAIDITAGEKERRTLQTLYTSTATIKEIVAGKFFAIASVGLISAAMNLFSFLVAIKLQAYLLGASDAGEIAVSISPFAILLLVLIVFLSTLFIGAFVMAIVLLANSYKEAQTYNGPLIMLILLPTSMALMPGMELSMDTVFIPMFNTALAIIALLKGDYNLTMIGIVVAMNLLYGILALYLASRTFGNENVITGEKTGWKELVFGGQ